MEVKRLRRYAGYIEMEIVEGEEKKIKVFEDMVVINDREIIFNKEVVKKYKEVVDVLVNHYRKEFIELMRNIQKIEKIKEGYHEVDLKINGIDVIACWEFKCMYGWHTGGFECHNCIDCDSSIGIYSIIINNIELFDILNGVDKEEKLDNDLRDAIEKLESIIQRAGWL
ncbi:hypothetical protein [Methanocaldococcus sp.]